MLRPTRPRSFLLLLALALHVAIGIWYVRTPAANDAAWRGFPLDDAWIHMVYGRSVAAHGWPLYNDTPEAGFSSPLWMLVLALAHVAAALTSCSAVAFAKGFGVLAAAATSATVGHLVLHLTRRPGLAVLATLLCAADPVLAFAQVSGMEVSITTLGAMCAAHMLARGRHGAAGVWLALAYLGRPECALLVPLFAIVPFAAVKEPMAQRVRRVLALSAPPVAAALAWAGYCWFATGHPLPNTFYAKFDLTVDAAVWPVVVAALGRSPANWLGLGVLLALLAPCAVRARHRVLAGALLVFPVLFVCAIARTRPCPPAAGEYFFFARYLAPAWPFLAAATALGAGLCVRFVASLRHPPLRAFGTVAAALALAALSLPHVAALATGATRYAKNCQNIDEVQVAFGHWVAANVPVGRAVAVNDAGAIRYVADRENVDLLGLNDARVLFAEPPLAQVWTGADAMADWLLRQRVDCLIVFPSWFEPLVRHPRFPARFTEVQRFVSADYTIADPRNGQATMVAFRVLPQEPQAVPGR